MDSKEAREMATKILASAGITMDVKHVPTTFDPQSKEWQHIAWSITFTSPRGTFTTSYKQGIGHLPFFNQPSNHVTLYKLEFINWALTTGKAVAWVKPNYVKTDRPLTPPDASDVVGSLILDASAADYATFEQWASDTGYNPDSRKDHAIWEAYRSIALDLNRVFGAGVVEALREPCGEL